MSNPGFLIAIVGGSASGKTRLADAVQAALGQSRCTVIAEDDYYVDAGRMPGFDPEAFNFDEPAAKDGALLETHLTRLKAGQGIECPVYEFETHCRSTETRPVAPFPVTIVEGLHLLAFPALIPLFDLTVFVDTPDELRFERRLRRDVAERGRDEAFASFQYEAHVRPMYELHVAPQAERADLIILNDGPPDFSGMAQDVLKAAGLDKTGASAK